MHREVEVREMKIQELNRCWAFLAERGGKMEEVDVSIHARNPVSHGNVMLSGVSINFTWRMYRASCTVDSHLQK